MAQSVMHIESPALRHAAALGLCVLTTLIAWPLHEALDLANTVMLFLLAVVLTAAFLGRGPAILASFASVAMFDVFFVPPRFSFAVSDVQYLITFAAMLALALFISHLTAGLKAGREEALAREQRTQALYLLARTLAGAVAVQQVADETVGFVGRHGGGRARLLLPDENDMVQAFAATNEMPEAALSVTEQMSAHAVFSSRMPIESPEIGESGEPRILLPLGGATRCRGVLYVVGRGSVDAGTRAFDRPLLEAVASLAAIALERLHFVEVAQATQIEMHSERLRSSILSAISHDIRTPLTALYGMADSLAAALPDLPAAERETVTAIRDQALRLHGMVVNLLDMARLQSGKLRMRTEWQPIEEVVGASIQAASASLRQHPVQVTLAPDLPLVAIDAVLIERVLCNLLENAVKFSPAGAAIAIAAARRDAFLMLSVCDRGSGFAPGSVPRVFAPFERAPAESPRAGFGLGLAICQAIVEAHGGGMEAENRDGGGACVRIMLPVGDAPAIELEPTEIDARSGQA